MILTNSTSILIPLSETSNLRVEVSLLGSSKISTPLHVSAPVRSEVKVEDGSNLGPAVTLAVFLTALVVLLIMLVILSRVYKVVYDNKHTINRSSNNLTISYPTYRSTKSSRSNKSTKETLQSFESFLQINKLSPLDLGLDSVEIKQNFK
ncbi:uncharacterized protein LOC111706669 [Eurytemora carolleeae]|uniref:uncharacterized protein LOC111706669 n=1 Tax=Eurytemora carolleeae TaxID=1294199 RepID=UPI000C77821D|nr:uncharacterized protein LOC111706669 [Eurytemora carolleeae]|eukprot:XP_023335347.1 uncharacterized protein LOC111706669 [Eurytemora affinis]